MALEREAFTALRIFRGACVETSHAAHIAVVAQDGRLLFSHGDPFRVTLARSAAKPFQSVAIIETGALDAFPFDEADLALMCASHSSEPVHLLRARAMLRKSDGREADLVCGGHPPLSEAVHRDWIKGDFTPTAVCSNCSGKHTGMLAGARALGVAVDDYHRLDHPMQERVKQVIADVSALDAGEIEWAIDGCNLPAPGLALSGIASAYAQLAAAADAAEIVGPPRPHARALARVFRAMTSHPEMVAGDGRFCTTLMRAYEGALVGKLGAEGCYGVAVRPQADTHGLGGGEAIGIAVKVEDGALAALYAVVVEVLEQLDIGSGGQRRALAAFHRPRRLNTSGVEVGSSDFPFRLVDDVDVRGTAGATTPA